MKADGAPPTPPPLFQGLSFLITGYAAEHRAAQEALSRDIEGRGGVVLGEVPPPGPPEPALCFWRRDQGAGGRGAAEGTPPRPVTRGQAQAAKVGRRSFVPPLCLCVFPLVPSSWPRTLIES